MRATINGWHKHNDSRLAAALAFYAVFSLAPLLLLIIAAVGLIYGSTRAQEEIQNQLTGVIGTTGSSVVHVLLGAFSRHGPGRLTLFVGGLLIVVYAAGLFLQLQNALDDIWEVKEADKGGIVRVVLFRAHVLLTIAALAIIAMGAFAGVDLMAALARSAGGSPVAAHRAIETASILLNIGALAAFLTITYRTLPQIDVGWTSAAIGGIITTVTLVLGEAGLSLYFAHAHPEAAYGTVASFVILLLWVHYSAVLLLFGAELTRTIETGAASP